MGQLTQDLEKRLSISDRRFCETWVRTGDNKASLEAGGFSTKNIGPHASRMRCKPQCKAYIALLQEETRNYVVQDAARTRDDVHKLINEGVEASRDGDPVVGKNGEAVLVKGEILRRVNVAGLFKGAELKGKTVGMFTDVQRIEGEMEGKSAEELAAFLKGAASDATVARLLAEVDEVERAVVARLVEKGDEYLRQTFGFEDAEVAPKPEPVEGEAVH